MWREIYERIEQVGWKTLNCFCWVTCISEQNLRSLDFVNALNFHFFKREHSLLSLFTFILLKRYAFYYT